MAQLKQLVYPQNLLTDNSRYGDQFMVLYINESPSGVKYFSKPGKDILNLNGDSVRNISESIAQRVGASEGGRVRGTTLGSAIAAGGAAIIPPVGVANAIRDPKKITKYAIFLPVPLSVKTNFGLEYEDLSLTDELAKIGGSVISQVAEGFLASRAGKSAKTDKEKEIALNGVKDKMAIGSQISGLLSNAAKIGGAITGLSINPHKELLFKGVNFRKFEFDYKLIARNQKESDLIKEICDLISFHMHPDLTAGSFLYNFPSEFDVEFYFRKKQTSGNSNYQRNPYLMFLSTCVMTNFDVDYGNKYVTFKDSGAPVEITIKMKLQETQIMTKESINLFKKYIENSDDSFSDSSGNIE